MESRHYKIVFGNTDFKIGVDYTGTCYECPSAYSWMMGMMFYDINDWVEMQGGKIVEIFSEYGGSDAEDKHDMEYWFFD